MVGHLGAVYHLPGVHRGPKPGKEGQYPGHGLYQRGQPRSHVLGKIPGIGTGVCHQPLFIQGLRVVKGLLGRVAVEPVGLPL